MDGTHAVENLQPAGLGPFNLTFDQSVLNIDTTLSAPVGSIYNLPVVTAANLGHVFMIKKIIDPSLAQIIIQGSGGQTIGLAALAVASIGLTTTNESVVLVAGGTGANLGWSTVGKFL